MFPFFSYLIQNLSPLPEQKATGLVAGTRGVQWFMNEMASGIWREFTAGGVQLALKKATTTARLMSELLFSGLKILLITTDKHSVSKRDLTIREK